MWLDARYLNQSIEQALAITKRLFRTLQTHTRMLDSLRTIASHLQRHGPKHHLIRDMILDQKLTTRQMADAAECSKRSIKAIRSNIHYFGTTKAPSNGRGRHRSITRHMLHLLSFEITEPMMWLVAQRRRD
jgi:hypothetical protein